MTIAHWVGAAAMVLGLAGTAQAGPDYVRPGPHYDRAPKHQQHAPPGHYRPAPPHYRPAPPQYYPAPPVYRQGYYGYPAPPPHPVVRMGHRIPPGHWGPPPPHYARGLRHRHGHEWRRVGSDVVLVSIATGIVAEVIYNALR